MSTDWSQMGVISRQKMGLEGGGGGVLIVYLYQTCSSFIRVDKDL